MNERKIIISDYDDTTVRHTEQCFYDVCCAVMGEDLFNKMKNISKDTKLDYFSAFINKDCLTKEEACRAWSNFKNTKIYSQLKKSKKQRVIEVLENGDRIPENEVTKHFIQDILCKIIVMYSIYIQKNVPEKKFFTLYNKIKKNNDIFLINTFKSQFLIEFELQEYVYINEKKYKAFNELLKNHLVIGTTENSCKSDQNRVKTILKKVNVNDISNNKIFIIGDSGTDFENFTEAYNLNTSSQFLFVKTRLSENLNKTRLLFYKLFKKVDLYKSYKEKLNKSKQELIKLNKSFQAYNKNNIKIGGYNKVTRCIY